jgi:LPXTG-site transpeptidase (sortase) family protein
VAHGLEIKRTRETHPIRWFLLVLLIASAGAVGWFGIQYFNTGNLPLGMTVDALRANPEIDESEVSDQQMKSHTVKPDEPRYISIPKLNLGNVRVFGVGVDANNQLQAPSNISDAAWYTKSSRPGLGYGAVLINAHNGGVRRDGAFAKLGTLAKGDTIEVERGDGKQFTYKVVENQSMPLEEVNATGMKMMMESAEEGKEGLNLITCDGNWVPKYKQFDRRIMLRAVLTN